MVEVLETQGGELAPMPEAPGLYRLFPLTPRTSGDATPGIGLVFEAASEPPHLSSGERVGDLVAVWGRTWGPRIGMVCEPMKGRDAESLIVLKGCTPDGRAVAFYRSALRRIDLLAFDRSP